MIEAYRSFLYNTGDASTTTFDCFYAHIDDDFHRMNGTFLRTNYLTRYCRRPTAEDWRNGTSTSIEGDVENMLTFETLRSQGIRSEDLYRWSMAIDVIEQYAIYLTENDPTLAEQTFYNCSSLWFGSRCEYTFGWDFSTTSFGDFVVASFHSRQPFRNNVTINTCYAHLSGCHRGPEPMCLDWREICDGKVDCIGENFAIDEEHCEELEVNECEEHQHRCHNGAHCIPKEFFRDGWTSTDCLDGTDEDDAVPAHPLYLPLTITFDCIQTSTFPCEERSCRQTQSFPCGDGHCRAHGLIIRNETDLKKRSCPGTNRDVHYLQAMYKTVEQLPAACARLFFCKLQIYRILKQSRYEESDCALASSQPVAQCSNNVVPFPTEPVFNDHYQLIYFVRDLIGNSTVIPLPRYVCFDPRRCQYLSNEGVWNEVGYCVPYSEIAEQIGLTEDLVSVHLSLASFALYCSTSGNINDEFPSYSSLFYCERSRRYISKHRLLDGPYDCFRKEDEYYDQSCSLSDSPRVQCTSKENEDKCLSLASPASMILLCFETYFQGHAFWGTAYPLLCDRILDTANEYGETDETMCPPWPCLTPYTRCDTAFQCPNGIDELNCPRLGCAVNELKCSINRSTDYRCVPHTSIYEKARNCSANLVEVEFCPALFYSRNSTKDKSELLPWKDSTCLTDNGRCANHSLDYQPSGCNLTTVPEMYSCETYLVNMDENKTLCSSRHKNIPSRSFRFFSVWNVGYLPLLTNNTRLAFSQLADRTPTTTVSMKTSIESIEYCNRGMIVYQGRSLTRTCLCPSSYFGDHCEKQSQRISLTLRMRQPRLLEQDDPIFDIFIYLIDDEERTIHSYEKINYIISLSCEVKFNRYLLYPSRPKDPNRNYSIHIDMYEKRTLTYYAGWYFSLPFPFLPVHRLAAQLLVSGERSQPSSNCSFSCGTNGQCFPYINSNTSFCKCNAGYSGRYCEINESCACSPDSICLTSSICLCSLYKFGSRCYLSHTACFVPRNPCRNHARCVPLDDRIDGQNFLCSCPDNATGRFCEHQQGRIDIALKVRSPPTFVWAHFITAYDHRPHEVRTTLKKVPFDQETLTLFNQQSFHLLFLEFSNHFYLAAVRERLIQSEHLITEITSDNICPNITQLLPSTIFNYSSLRQMMHYQIPCLNDPRLKCFYDNSHLCICDQSRYANCLFFNHNVSYDCRGSNPCQNRGQCFQDNATCPTKSMCVCERCYYGSKCQLTTKGFSLSLDAIFGYYIKPRLSFIQQSISVKITASITMLMFLCSLINTSLSIVTFRRQTPRKVGCGLYLLATSAVSLVAISSFAMKYWQLVLFQMSVITNHSVQRLSCALTDSLVRASLSTCDWLNAFVAFERAYTSVRGVAFDKKKSVDVAKRAIVVLAISVSLSHLHDPIFRQLFDDKDEGRTWCIVDYPPAWRTYDAVINFVHFLSPFIINLLSVVILIIRMFKVHRKTQTKQSRRTILWFEIQQYKHLIISPCVLISIACPRLFISLLSRCMESTRDPWLFLAGYYISVVPSLLTFVVFVLPSQKYKLEFLSAMNRNQQLPSG